MLFPVFKMAFRVDKKFQPNRGNMAGWTQARIAFGTGETGKRHPPPCGDKFKLELENDERKTMFGHQSNRLLVESGVKF